MLMAPPPCALSTHHSHTCQWFPTAVPHGSPSEDWDGRTILDSLVGRPEEQGIAAPWHCPHQYGWKLMDKYPSIVIPWVKQLWGEVNTIFCSSPAGLSPGSPKWSSAHSRKSFFSLISPTIFPRIIYQTNYLHLNPCLRICFVGGNLKINCDHKMALTDWLTHLALSAQSLCIYKDGSNKPLRPQAMNSTDKVYMISLLG